MAKDKEIHKPEFILMQNNLTLRFLRVVVEDARIRFVKRRRRGFGIRDRIVRLYSGLFNGNDRMLCQEGNGRNMKRRWKGMLQHKGDLGASLPESCEQHDHEAELANQKHRPYARL